MLALAKSLKVKADRIRGAVNKLFRRKKIGLTSVDASCAYIGKASGKGQHKPGPYPMKDLDAVEMSPSPEHWQRRFGSGRCCWEVGKGAHNECVPRASRDSKGYSNEWRDWLIQCRGRWWRHVSKFFKDWNELMKWTEFHRPITSSIYFRNRIKIKLTHFGIRSEEDETSHSGLEKRSR